MQQSEQSGPESATRLKWRALSMLASTLPGGRGAVAEERAVGMADVDDVAADFAERLIGILNGGALALMISIGHRTGLFEVMAGLPAATAAEIASAARLAPRYVRDWLDVMASGGLVCHDADRETYHLPEEYVPALTRASGADVGALAACVAGLGAFEEQVVACFRTGGAPAAAWPAPGPARRAPDIKLTTPPLLEAVLPLIPGLAVDLHRGIDVLEVGCGSARGLNMLAESFPNSRFTGLDPDADQLALAATEASMLGLANVAFRTVDPQALDIEDRYDLIGVAPALVRADRAGRGLDAAARGLRARGTLILESDLVAEHAGRRLDSPLSPLLHTLACVRSLRSEPAPDRPQADPVARLRAAGFRRIRIERPAHALKSAVVIARRH